jgi:hypothetical protein
LNSFIGSIPYHKYIWVDSSFTHKKNIGFIPAVWFGLCSFPSRAWGLNIMLESGAVYRNIPPHAISFCEENSTPWTIEQSQLWDCYGYHWSAVEYIYLKGLSCKAFVKEQGFIGTYLFTVAPVLDGFSAAPEQSKEFKFIELDNGRLTIQPTNKVLFIDKSFTDEKNKNLDLKLQKEIYCCE